MILSSALFDKFSGWRNFNSLGNRFLRFQLWHKFYNSIKFLVNFFVLIIYRRELAKLYNYLLIDMKLLINRFFEGKLLEKFYSLVVIAPVLFGKKWKAFPKTF